MAELIRDKRTGRLVFSMTFGEALTDTAITKAKQMLKVRQIRLDNMLGMYSMSMALNAAARVMNQKNIVRDKRLKDIDACVKQVKEEIAVIKEYLNKLPKNR